MVVASFALLVALGGTSIAAVTAAVPNNSVGTSQLKSNAVTTPKIKNSAVNASKLASNAVTSAKIASNAVTNAKIANGTIQPADLSAAAKTSGPQGPPGPQGPQGPPGVASPGYVAQVTSQTGGGAVTTSSTAFVNLAGASETITVPTGETARIYAVFTGESLCTGGGGWCIVRITVDGNELNPAVGTDFAWDSPGDSYESHAIARTSETLAAGAHTAQVQIAATSGETLRIDDWSLVIFRTKVS
jgi:hypothetical protein